MTISLRYPAGTITPQGVYYLLGGQVPSVKLRSWDDTAVFNLMGGENIADYYNAPENVYVKDMKGLVPPWKQIKQKGATEDGASFVTSLYDPAEVELTVVVKGKTARRTQKTVNDLVASIDAIQTSELSFFTHELGYWFAPVRWMAAPMDPEGGTRTKRQVLNLRLIAFNAFWRTFDVVDQFRLGHTTLPDTFGTDHGSDLGSGWTVALSGAGSGGLTVVDGQVVPTLDGKTAVARRVGFTGTNPVIELQLGSFPQWFFDSSTAFDFWVMSGSGTPGDNGYRIRVNNNTVTTTKFASGTGTLVDTKTFTIPPKSAESWTFVGGPTFKLLRSGAMVYSFKPTTAPGFTAAGFGLFAAGNVPPPNVRAISFGTDAPATQSGFVRLVNWGDQPMPPRFTCVGPGTFYLGNGPNATEFVKFGPLLDGQTAQIITDARKRGVVDLSSAPTDTTEQNLLASGLQDLFGFFNLIGGVIQAFTGLFGSGSTPLPPQGNLYALMQGRFSSQVYIPPKPVGGPPQGYHIPVKIENGTASSQILAAATPLRRRPY